MNPLSHWAGISQTAGSVDIMPQPPHAEPPAPPALRIAYSLPTHGSLQQGPIQGREPQTAASAAPALEDA